MELIEGRPTVVVIRRQRVKRKDLAEAYRLMAKHRDIVRGTPRASAGTGFRLGERMPLG